MRETSDAILRQIKENAVMDYTTAINCYTLSDFSNFSPKNWELFFPKTLGCFKEANLRVEQIDRGIKFTFSCRQKDYDIFAPYANVVISNFPSNCGTLIFNGMHIFNTGKSLSYDTLLEELEMLAYTIGFTCVCYNSLNTTTYAVMNKTFEKRKYENVFDFRNNRSGNVNYFWFKNLREDE